MIEVTNRDPDLLGGSFPGYEETEPIQCKAWELVVPQPGAFRLVCGWVIYAPYAHPFWRYYTIECIHLRPIEGQELKMYLPDATHEFVLWALDPNHVPVIDGPNHLLEPKNFAVQFVAKDDEAARLRLKSAVQDVIDGLLNPDTDYTFLWVQEFGDNMMKDRK